MLEHRLFELRHFATSSERRWIGTIAATAERRSHYQAAADSELVQFFDAGSLIRLTEVQAHQDRAVAALRAFKHSTQMGIA
jgi:hypothetical protein